VCDVFPIAHLFPSESAVTAVIVDYVDSDRRPVGDVRNCSRQRSPRVNDGWAAVVPHHNSCQEEDLGHFHGVTP
jgi:hypothetical protein